MSGTVRECIEAGLAAFGRVASGGVIVVMDLTEERVILAEPDDFGRFSIAVEGDGGPEALASLVGETNLGRVVPDGTQVAVDPIALKSLAGPSATPAWEDGFEKMRAYAAGKGWVEADGAILAHIEWRDG
ncbi:MAG TPA: hypothetical protein VGL48_01960 [Acidimicrobiales bacterium]|jgi:hypothetical protein